MSAAFSDLWQRQKVAPAGNGSHVVVHQLSMCHVCCRLKGDAGGGKKGRASVEDEVKGLRRLQLQAIKDLRQVTAWVVN